MSNELVHIVIALILFAVVLVNIEIIMYGFLVICIYFGFFGIMAYFDKT